MPLPELGQALMAQALDAGPGDNITLVLIEVTALDPETARSPPQPPVEELSQTRRFEVSAERIAEQETQRQKAGACAPPRVGAHRLRDPGGALCRSRRAVDRNRQHPAQAPCPRAHAGADGCAHAEPHAERPAAGDPAPDADARTGAGAHARAQHGADANTVAGGNVCTRALPRLTRGGAMRIIAYKRFDTFRA